MLFKKKTKKPRNEKLKQKVTAYQEQIREQRETVFKGDAKMEAEFLKMENQLEEVIDQDPFRAKVALKTIVAVNKKLLELSKRERAKEKEGAGHE